MKHKHRTTTIALISLLLMVIIAAGCGAGKEAAPSAASGTPQQEASTQAAAQATATPATAAPAPRVVSTLMGDVEVPADPSRIVLVYHDDIDHLMALGVKPVAVPTYERPGSIDGYLPYLAEELKGVEKIGNAPNLEAILAANPDLIIASYAYKDMMDQLKKIAPTLVFEWKTDWRETHLAIGKALGRESKAQANIDEYNALVKDAKQKLGTAVGNKTVAFIRVLPKEIRIHGLKDQVPGFLLYEQLGLTPSEEVPVEEWAKPISNEIFAQLKADHILLHINDNPDAAAQAKELLENEAYKNVPAVKNGQVHLVPSHPWERGGPLAFKEGIQQVLEAMVQ
ncbi:MAG: iron-siderophore transporter substrate-binding protein [Paenibacillaceae bacterium]|jgi:iron complex transport system substrate-binding protein|nr:iron-siderophore transporter substrate-binding protein [Paenibacillaceae bacterium]